MFPTIAVTQKILVLLVASHEAACALACADGNCSAPTTKASDDPSLFQRRDHKIHSSGHWCHNERRNFPFANHVVDRANADDSCTCLDPGLAGHVELGEAGVYAILSSTGISTVPISAITGNMGVSPSVAATITGFSLSQSDPAFAESSQLTGIAHAADYGGTTPLALDGAVLDMQAAYTFAASYTRATSAPFLNLGSGNLGGKTLVPGVYTFNSGVTIPSSCWIDAGGVQDSMWIFQIDGGLTMAANKEITLAGTALASNVVWQVAGAVSIGAGSHMEGIILGKTSVTFITGSSLNGRILAQTFVALQMSTIVQPDTACCCQCCVQAR